MLNCCNHTRLIQGIHEGQVNDNFISFVLMKGDGVLWWASVGRGGRYFPSGSSFRTIYRLPSGFLWTQSWSNQSPLQVNLAIINFNDVKYRFIIIQFQVWHLWTQLWIGQCDHVMGSWWIPLPCPASQQNYFARWSPLYDQVIHLSISFRSWRKLT